MITQPTLPPITDLEVFLQSLAGRKPTIPEVLSFFAAYFAVNPAWGSLHVVLDDGNHKDDDVRFSIDWARDVGDRYGELLAEVLLRMSRTQRGRISALAFRAASAIPGSWLSQWS